MRKLLLIYMTLVLLAPTTARANTWFFTNRDHPTVATKRLETSFSGGNNTRSLNDPPAGETIFPNGTTYNAYATDSFPTGTMPAGTWTFSITARTNSSTGWYPRIKILNSSGTIVHTSTCPNEVATNSWTTYSWTDSVPSFSLGPNNLYGVQVFTYRTTAGNRRDRIRINSGYSANNYVVDPYGAPASYSPYTRSWRWYDDAGSLNPSVPLAGENVTPTGMYNGNQVRLRETISELDGGDQTGRKKMQYSSDSVNFSDVSAIGSGDPWAYCDGGGTDDNLVSSLLVSTSDTYGPFVENGTAASSFTHQGNTMAEFDFCLQENFALTNQTYYFRVVDVESGNPIYPEATYNWPTITISDHGLNVEILNDFEITTLNMEDAPGPTTGSFANIKVMDYRGTNAGWSLTATATDLVRDGGSETIDIENISLTATTVSAEYAESTAGISTGSGDLSNTVPLNIATASAGNGAGNLFISGDISFTVPVASVPGDYTGTVTLTVS